MKPRALLLLFLLSAACVTPEQARRDAQAFVDAYEARYQVLYADWNEAEWQANTRIVAGDDSRVLAAEEARKRYAAFTGSEENIAAARRSLKRRRHLTPVQVRQFEKMLHLAAGNPQSVPGLTARLIEAEARQTQDLYGFAFRLDGLEVTPNDLDDLLRESADLGQRRRAWEASKEVGPALKAGLAELRDLRNGVVRALGYDDYFSYQVADYGMSAAEMNAMMERLNRELRPLYRELHTWARYTLAARYGEPVPVLLPAHWLPDRWAQDWDALVQVEGVDVTAAIQDRDADWVVRQGEEFYVSMGFEPLPQSFWVRSSLYPVPAGAGFKKNSHASAWHMDLDRDVRTLMSIVPNADWYGTVHHELGHVYYDLEYSRPGVPLLLRAGANRAFHEAIGSQMGLAAMQRPFLEARGLVDSDAQVDQLGLLLREALDNVVFIPFGAGVMPFFEHALYAEELAPDEFNARWWELVTRYQGVAPPSARGEEWADALSKTHINDDPAQYYDYALSTVLLFQFHEHIAREILHQDPHATNYYGRQDVGDYLRAILSVGATRDWRELLLEATGSELSAEPMVDYFEPLMSWLQEQNQGRTHTLQDL